ncbi:MAG TPA: RNA polymerase sigma factor [Candidatus Binatia bacterium]|nr:RNA polymerase sigma factor [Candidatus Binatia bacterium]
MTAILDPARSTGDPVGDVPAGSLRPEVVDERVVVDRVLAGEREAFRILVEREHRAVVRICYRILGNLHDAEDAAQETFVNAFRALPSWRRDGPFGAWLARIAVRIATRRAAGRRTVEWLDPAAPEPEAGGAAPDPLVAVVRSEAAAHLRGAVARLEEPYRGVVALRFFADLPLAEIARLTGRPVPTVKTQLRRGLLRLRDAVEGAL